MPYWIAINGSSVAATLLADLPAPQVIPTPETLIGFPTREEAAETQKFLLTASIPSVAARLQTMRQRKELEIYVFKKPGKPTKETQWIFPAAAQP